MKKERILLFFFLSPLFIIAQTTAPKVVLKVMDCKTRAAVEGAIFRIVGQDGSNHNIFSDSLGEFHFNLPFTTNYLINCEAPAHPTVPLNECWDFSLKYLNAQQAVLLDTAKLESDKTYLEEFCVMPMNNEYYRFNLPKACFVENDTLFSQRLCWTYQPDSMIKCIAELLRKKPEIYMKVATKSHWEEKEPQRLSEDRLKMVKRLLLEKGVDESQLYLKSYGLEEPLMPEELFDQFYITEEDRIIGALQNRMVYFWIVDKDGKEIR